MRPFFRRLPHFARIALVLINFGVLSGLFGLDAPQAAAAAATITTLTSNANPSAYGQTVTFTAAVSGSSPTGTVTFTDTANGYSYTLGTATLSGGTATLGTALAGGSHQVVASYAGDTANSASTSAVFTQNVTKTSTSITLTSSLNPSSYGDGITFTATITGSNPTGTVTLTDASTSTTYTATSISSGVATFSTSTPFRNILFGGGTHRITASYGGDSNNSASTSAPFTQTVNKFVTSTMLYSGTNPSLSGQSNTVTATINNSAGGPATGTITFMVDGTPQTASINGYSAAYDASSLPVGTHTITAAYSGDSNFTSSTSQTFTQTVNAHVNPQYVSPSGSDSNSGTQAAPKLTIQAAINTALSGDTVVVENGTYTGPGDVDLDFGGKNLTVASQNGAAATIIDCGGTANANHRGFYLHSGETSAVISGLTIQNGNESNGGGIYCGGVGAAIQNCILKNNTAGFCGGGFYNSSSTGSAISVTNSVFTGNTVELFGGGLYNYNNAGTTTVTNCTFTGNGSTRNGTDNGGGIYSQPSGVITLTNDILYGDTGGELGNQYGTGPNSQPTYYSITNCDIQGGYTGGGNLSADPYFYNLPTDLHLQAGSPCLGAGTASGAPATTLDGRTRPAPPSIGAYEGAATGAASASVTLTSSLNPSTAGQSVTFTARVAGNGGTPTGTVNLSIDSIIQAHVPLSGGTASYTTASLSSGSHSVVATYSGDTSFAPGTSSTLTQTINPIGTMMALTSTPNPSQYGQAVTFSAAITGSSSAGTGPSGSITLTDAATGTVLVTRRFTGVTPVNIGYSYLAVGSHQIVASYSGDSFYGPSTSAPLTQTVTQAATTVTLASSLNPSIAGQSVTFTASVATTSTAIPTGTVTFFVDDPGQPPVALSSSLAATFTTSALTAGSHTITARYNGDTNFSPSTSVALTQTVNAHVSPQYVSPSGSDTNSGTRAAPKLTIQAAISAALSGDTVIVEDGTYTGSGDVDIDFGGRNLTVTSQNGAAATIIDCGGTANANHRGFYLHSGETSAVISGLTIQNGYEYGSGGGICNSGVSVAVQSCILKNNVAVYGGGMFNQVNENNGGAITVTDCVLIGNAANSYGQGGGMLNSGRAGSAITVLNCTLTGNTAMIGSNGLATGGGIYNSGAASSTITLTNTILYNDAAGEVIGGAATVSNCDIQGGYAGTSNISADPLFVNPSSDLHLQYGSPCLGAGTASGAPATTIDGMMRPNPPSIGAYEAAMTGTQTALASSLNPSVAGQSVTFTATVTGTSGTPTGTVTFTLDGAAQAPVSLASGQATLTTAALAVGTHTLTAAYSGDQFNAASTSAALTQTVNPLSSSLINDTDPGITYAGSGWSYYPNRSVGDYQADVHATAVNGDSLSYTFTGTSVSYITETNSDEGNVQVYLDGTLQTTVSAQSAARQVQQTLWSKTGLASGPHTLKLVKASGTYMLLDAVQVSPAQVAVTAVNDTAGGLAYAGSGWFYRAGRGLGDFQDDVHATTVNSDAVSYTFTGMSISYLTETNSDEGNVQVFLDGILQTTVSCNSATRQVQQVVWSRSGLSAGPHTLKLVKQDGQVMVLDALKFTPAAAPAGLVNDTGSGVTYSGSSWGYYSGRGLGDVNDDVHAATANGDAVSLTFTGTSVSYLTETNADEGNVAVYVDGALQQTVSCATASRSVQQAVYSVSGLASGPHTLKLVKTGGAYMLVDAFRFQ